MTEIITSFPKRPKWANRQLIAASDLTAEQKWQDAQLARLRQFALGWGVVAGLEVEGHGDLLRISPGYGITAAGSEIYLPEEVDLTEIHSQICVACGGDPNDCAEPKEAEGGGVQQTGWLVLRPVVLESCPRATLPEGCEHPGSSFAYSRQGMGIKLAFECEIPEHLLRSNSDCALVESYLGEAPVPLPTAADDVLPLARIVCLPKLVQQVDMAKRRRLLPLSVLQDIVDCCECHEPAEPPDVPDEPDEPLQKPWDRPDKHEIGDLVETITDALPGGEADFGLAYKHIFGVSDGFRLTERRIRKVSLVTQSFAASLLVQDEDGLARLTKGEFPVIYKDATGRTGGIDLLGRFALEARDLPDMTLARLWKDGKTGYQSAQQDFGNNSVGEIMELGFGKMRRNLLDATVPELAAIYWIIQRTATIMARR